MPSTKPIALKPTSRKEFLYRRAYIVWAGFWWFLSFLILYPFFLVCIWIPLTRKMMAVLNRIWCLFFFPVSFLRVRTQLEPSRSYGSGPVIYVSNHGSYLDIPLLTFILPGFPAFLGKASLGTIPMFGYMFRNLHITVERGSNQGRAKAFQQCSRSLATGRSIVIFPEGSIHHKLQPGLADFKDGAFRLAIQNEVPIVPITICHNWYILPDDGRWLPNYYTCEAVIHKPILTKGLKESDCQKLSYRVSQVIGETLKQRNEELIQKISNDRRRRNA